MHPKKTSFQPLGSKKSTLKNMHRSKVVNEIYFNSDRLTEAGRLTEGNEGLKNSCELYHNYAVKQTINKISYSKVSKVKKIKSTVSLDCKSLSWGLDEWTLNQRYFPYSSTCNLKTTENLLRCCYWRRQMAFFLATSSHVTLVQSERRLALPWKWPALRVHG